MLSKITYMRKSVELSGSWTHSLKIIHNREALLLQIKLKKTQALCRHGNHDRENEQLDEVIYGISPTSIRKTNKKHQSAILNSYLWETESRSTIAMCLHMLEYREQGSDLWGSEKSMLLVIITAQAGLVLRWGFQGCQRLCLEHQSLCDPYRRRWPKFCFKKFILLCWLEFVLVYFLSASVDCIFMADCLLNMFLPLEWLQNVGRLSTLLTSKTSTLLPALSPVLFFFNKERLFFPNGPSQTICREA